MTVAEWIAAVWKLPRYAQVMVLDNGVLRRARPPRVRECEGRKVVVIDAPED